MIRPAGAWFASDEARDAMTPVLERSYDRERPGVPRRRSSGRVAAHRRLRAVGGRDRRCAQRLEEELEPETARVALDWYRSSSSSPARSAPRAGARSASSRSPRVAPQRPLGAEELRLVEVFAGLAALALERTELLDREERRGREERELNEAARAVSDVAGARHRLHGDRRAGRPGSSVRARSPCAATSRPRPTCARSRRSASARRAMRTRFRVGEGMIGQVARTGQSYVSDPADADRFARAFLERERSAPSSTSPSRSGRACSACSRPATSSPATTAPERAHAPGGARAARRGRHRQRARLPPRAPRRRRPHARDRGPRRTTSRLRARPRLRARRPRRRRRRHLRRVAAPERRPGGARGRRHRQGPRGRGAERDGALLRRGAHLGLRAPGGRPRPDRPAAGRATAERRASSTAFMGVDRRRHAALGQRRARAAVLLRPEGERGTQGHRGAARRRGRRRTTRSTRRPSGPATCCSPRPMGSSRPAATASFFGERRLPTSWPSTAERWHPASSSTSCTARSKRGRRSSTTTWSCSPCARSP